MPDREYKPDRDFPGDWWVEDDAYGPALFPSNKGEYRCEVCNRPVTFQGDLCPSCYEDDLRSVRELFYEWLEK